MVGRRVLLRVEKGPAKPGADRARGREPHRQGRPRRRPRSTTSRFNVRAGEIVGIAGVAGNGQSELLEAHRRHPPRRPRAASRSTASRSTSPARPTPRRVRDGSASPTCPRTATAWAWCSPSRRTRTRSSATTTTRATSTVRSSTSTRSAPTPREKIEKFDIRPPDCRAEDRELLRRQPAEDRARPRDRAAIPTCCSSASRRAASTSAPSSSSTAASSRMRDRGKAMLLVSVELDEIRSLSDRILVMFDGRIVGERGPRGRRERTRPADGRRRAARGRARSARSSTPDASCRAGPTTALMPLLNLAARLPRRRPRRPVHRREPARGRAAPAHGALGYGEGIGFTLYYATNFIFTGLGRRRLPCRPVQHRRRGPGLYRRPRRRAGLPRLRRGAAWWLTLPARHPRRRRLRRRLGVHPGLAAGQARQPHRHHHDHVQLHRLGADGLSARQRARSRRASMAPETRTFAEGAHLPQARAG